MDFVAGRILGEVCAGYLLLDDELHRKIRLLLGQIAQMDKIEHAVDLIQQVLVVGASDDGSCCELAIAKVLGNETVRILGKPLERMPTVIGGGGTHAAAVAEVGQANHMSADRR